MRSRSFIVLLAIVALACGLFIVRAQEPEDDVRGAFISTRPKMTNNNAPARRRRTRNANSSSATQKNANQAAANANHSGNLNSAVVHKLSEAIGLGYTLFMRDPNGRTVRAEPSREFHNGDSVRIALEPNVDGYLYVFHTEGNGAPEMIYPDWRLEGGENWIEAHVPIEVPSSTETDERLRWFTFYGNAGIERLYVVVSREPLPLVPTGDRLVTFCAANKDKCPWHPVSELWSQIQNGIRANVKVVEAKSFGQAQSEKEQIATTRGLGLDQTAPEPSVIRMSASTNAPLLVTVLDLIHK
ncbi:MAG: DUF4384 domain-containing protein [Acidobacteriota bacterium]